MLADDARLLRNDALFRDSLGVLGATELVPDVTAELELRAGAPVLVRRSLRADAVAPRGPSDGAVEAIRAEAGCARLASADSSIPRFKDSALKRADAREAAVKPNSDASDAALSLNCLRR